MGGEGADAGRCLVGHNHHQTCFRPSLDNSVWFVQLHRRSGAMAGFVIIRTVDSSYNSTEQATRNNPTPNHQRFPLPSPHPTLPHQLPHHHHHQYHHQYPPISTSPSTTFINVLLLINIIPSFSHFTAQCLLLLGFT